MKLSKRTIRRFREFRKAFMPYSGPVFAAISLLLLLWVTLNVHPGPAFAESDALGGRTNILTDLTTWSEETKASLVTSTEEMPEKYTIPESAPAGPKPDPACYGESYTPRDALAAIESARAVGLLGEDERVIFSPDADFYPDTLTCTYQDDTILVICWKEMLEGRVCSFCEVKIADASQMRRKLSQDTYGSPVKAYATELSAQVNAVVAMNADLYLQRDMGVTVYNRDVYRFNEWWYTGRYNQYNCIDTLMIDSSGNFRFLKMGEQRTRGDVEQFVADNDILYSIAFGPILVEDGQLKELDWYPLGEINDQYSRAGLAQVDALHYLYMTVSHSERNTPTCNINEFARLFHSKGVQNAYAFDGGQTGELVFNGEPYNHIDFGAERTVSDIIYFATAVPNGPEVG